MRLSALGSCCLQAAGVNADRYVQRLPWPSNSLRYPLLPLILKESLPFRQTGTCRAALLHARRILI